MKYKLKKLTLFIFVLSLTSTSNADTFFHVRGDGYVGQNRLFRLSDTKRKSTTAKVNNSENNRSLELKYGTDTVFWDAAFEAAGHAKLAKGTYLDALRFPFNGANYPGVSFTGEGRGCNEATGSFKVLDLAVSKKGVVTRAAIDFTQFCDAGTKPLLGSLRYNSSKATSLCETLLFANYPGLPLTRKSTKLYDPNNTRVGAVLVAPKGGKFSYRDGKVRVTGSLFGTTLTMTAKIGKATANKTLENVYGVYSVSVSGDVKGLFVAGSTGTLKKVDASTVGTDSGGISLSEWGTLDAAFCS